MMTFKLKLLFKLSGFLQCIIYKLEDCHRYIEELEEKEMVCINTPIIKEIIDNTNKYHDSIANKHYYSDPCMSMDEWLSIDKRTNII